MGAFKPAVCAAIIGISIYFTKRYASGGICTSTATIPGKVVIVTGANTGIGKETAADLVKRGGKVYMACRSLERCNKARQDIIKTTGAKEDNLLCTKLDLGSTKSMREFVADFKTKETKLDILINNAGVMLVPQGKTEDGFEIQFGVNHLGQFLLTNLLMNEIISAAPSRVITVSSIAHYQGSGTINFDDPMTTKKWSSWEAYGQSKLANLLFSKELGKRLEGTGVTTYSLHPGLIQTELSRYIPIISQPPVNNIFHFLTWPFLKDPWHGAQTQICCAVDENLSKETGKYYSDCAEKLPGVPAAFDDQVAKQLWDLSVKLLNLNETELHPKLQ